MNAKQIAERITKLLGVNPSNWTNVLGDNYDWAIPSTTIDRLAPSLVEDLRSYGCHLFNVDSFRDPYYYVVVRFVAK